MNKSKILLARNDRASFDIGKVYKVPQLPSSFNRYANKPYNATNDIFDEEFADGFFVVKKSSYRKNHERNERPFSADYESPFSISTDQSFDPAEELHMQIKNQKLDPTHPKTDAAGDIDSTQAYNEGLAGAAEASEPNAGNCVTGYRPEKKFSY